MEHLLTACDLLVIMIGLAAPSIAPSWVLRTGQGDVRNFCILYALLTLVMVSCLRRITSRPGSP